MTSTKNEYLEMPPRWLGHQVTLIPPAESSASNPLQSRMSPRRLPCLERSLEHLCGLQNWMWTEVEGKTDPFSPLPKVGADSPVPIVSPGENEKQRQSCSFPGGFPLLPHLVHFGPGWMSTPPAGADVPMRVTECCPSSHFLPAYLVSCITCSKLVCGRLRKTVTFLII